MIAQCLERLTIATAYSRIAPKGDGKSDRQQARDESSRKRRKLETPVQPPDILQSPPALHFYLHRPQTSSKCPVLIPLSPSETLAEALHGRLVLEFPTLYVLRQRPGELPTDRFMLEDEYLKECGVEESVESRSDGEVTDEDNEDENAGAEDETDALRRVDEKNVIQALLKDMSGLGESED